MSGAGNSRLVDMGNILDLQLHATTGTYVADNERLCFDASIQWTRRDDSLLEHLDAAVRFVPWVFS
jgi:hypothetical protein